MKELIFLEIKYIHVLQGGQESRAMAGSGLMAELI
jgi:hypothetical protein